MKSDSLIVCFKKHGLNFHQPVPFNPLNDLLLRMDFTENNRDLSEEILGNTQSFSDYVRNKLIQNRAAYGIGGYAEHRTIYSRSLLFDPAPGLSNKEAEAEPRRLHLGIDIWGKPLTKVMAPVDGMVHSFAFNNAFGDYGATIVLSHRVEEESFYTLYGHLSLASIRNLREGERINKGDVFAEFGIPQENGNWPPHLHFQIIKNMQGMKGDYPGVCAYSGKEQFLENCPDPDLILNMMQYAKP